MDLASAAFWTALGSIVLANVLLSGDNAVVIALAARGLPPAHQKKAIVLGSVAAIIMRVLLTIVAVKLLTLPWLKVIGGLLLLYIGVDLLLDDEEEAGDRAAKPVSIASAVRIILVADLVMSLDNVLAVAAAAQGNTPLLVIGLAISIPLIVFGSTMLLKVMERFPLIITGGAALLGWLAGGMVLEDPGLRRWTGELPPAVTTAASIAGAVFVVGVGRWLQHRAARASV